MSKNRDALKFFHNFVREMIDVGGQNLPKSISVSLGAKLGKLLKKRGLSNLEESLKKIYTVLNAKTKVHHVNEDTLDISLRYRSNFCPLGGKYNPERAKLIQEILCVPYTIAILNSLNSDYKYNIDVNECILNSHNKVCRYSLYKKLKDGNMDNKKNRI
ncbi:MAG: hypothetical protein ACFFEY_14255 [Candidatus Thorarchaeota archaeon]